MRRAWPTSLYNIPANEAWLAEQARRGWLLESAVDFVKFQKTEPGEYRYRLEPLPRREWKPDPEVREACETAGWEYVTTVEGYFHIYRTADPAAPELHTDPVVQGDSFVWMYRKYRRSLLLFAVQVLVSLGVLVGWTRWVPEVLFFADQGYALPLLVLTLLAITLGAVRQGQEARAISRMLKQLRAGIPLSHQGNYRRGSRWQAVAICILALMAGCCLISRTTTPLTEYGGPLPAIPLAELEPVVEGAEAWDTVTVSHSLLSPVGYQVTQYDHLVDRESAAYSYAIRTKLYRLSFAQLAQPLARQLVEQYQLFQKNKAVEVLPDPRFDDVLFLSGFGDDWYLAVTRGRQVLFLSYSGRHAVEMRDCLDGVVAVLDAFE